jgi:hypothetical protein
MKEWTLMFYFASDNPLAPGIVSQLKSLKNAGYHPDVNVVAYFDPHPLGTPAHIFDVNGFEKLTNSKPKIGFRANDPFVRNLMFDKLWGVEKGRDGDSIRDMIQRIAMKPGFAYTLPPLPSEKSSEKSDADNHTSTPGTAGNPSGLTSGSDSGVSLKAFLKFCADTENYRAKHYMLFILGHGLVVGDDVFLFDEHGAEQTVTLRNLGTAIKGFKDQISKFGGNFELISFHSCSMSSLEVAFELQGTANYMLASQGPAFVASWPYTQILIRIFNDVRKDKIKTPEDIEKMLKKIFALVYNNSTDFLLAGYSFDLCLCDLNKMKAIEEPIKELSKALMDGLVKKPDDDPIREMATICILLAHWKSQSYWNDNYTDFYDFCSCLSEYCRKFISAVKDPRLIIKIQKTCDDVIAALTPSRPGSPTNSPVISTDFAGPQSQYSHGLSVFFPWTRPTSDRTIMKEDPQHKKADGQFKKEYELYKFSEQTEWFGFLNDYWGPNDPKKGISGTMRDSITEEKARAIASNPHSKEKIEEKSAFEKLVEDIASLMFNTDGPLNTSGALGGEKTHPPDPTGDECTCGSIKNYRRDTRKRSERSESVEQWYPMSRKNRQATAI